MSASNTDFVPTDAAGKPLSPLPVDNPIHGHQWSAERAKAWYAGRPWIAGANFVPRSAINELEMWQADTFDPDEIDRPLIFTEYMARPRGSTFQAVMPLLRTEGVGVIDWGFVSGKSQTIYPWDSWQQAYPGEPKV